MPLPSDETGEFHVASLFVASRSGRSGRFRTGHAPPWRRKKRVKFPRRRRMRLRAADSETIVLAGGCFWGVQGVFQHVKGVTSAVSGYEGGDKATAHYEMTGSGNTGHAESVRVTYRSARNQHGPHFADLFLGGARSDPAEPPGAGPGHAIPLGDFPDRRGAGQAGESLYRPTRSGACLSTRRL